MSATHQPMPSDVEPLWTVRQLARRLGIHPTRLYLLVRRGAIPHLRIGRTLRFDPEIIRAWERAGGSAAPGPAITPSGERGFRR